MEERHGTLKLDGKVTLVTGGGSGIGEAICRAYAEQGASVLVADINADHGERVAAELAASGAFQRTNVTDLASVRAAVAAAVEGFSRLDVLVNCAGLGLVGNVQETASADWDRRLAVNVTGCFHGSRAAVDQFLGQAPSGGVIVNIASVAGQIGVPRRFAYCATKGAVIAITKQLAVDYAQQGIRCNAICPGTVYTPYCRPRRLGTARRSGLSRSRSMPLPTPTVVLARGVCLPAWPRVARRRGRSGLNEPDQPGLSPLSALESG